jgi:hypothetical protein
MAILAIVAVMALLAATAGPATAAAEVSGPFTNYGKLSGTGMHTWAGSWATVTGMITPNHAVKDFCWIWGQDLGTTLWDVVYNPDTNTAGFTNEGYLKNDPYEQTLRCTYQTMDNYYHPTNSNRPAGQTGVHTCTNNTCAVVRMFDPPYEWGWALCYSYGADLGTGDNRWVLIYSESGYVGWVHELWLTRTADNQC